MEEERFEEEVFAPQLAAAPDTVKDSLASALAALDLGTPAVDTTAVSLLRSALQQGLPPDPSSVTASHPDAPSPPTAIQAKSVAGWREGGTFSCLPSREEVMRASRRNLVATAAPLPKDTETTSMEAAASAHYPDASDPIAMAEYALKKGWTVFTPRTPGTFPPRPTSQAPGFVPSLDAEGMCKAHAEHCSRCLAHSPCLGVAACHYLANATLPWSATTTGKEGLQATPTPSPYDPVLLAAVAKVKAVGALRVCPPHTIRNYAHAFLAPATDVALSLEQARDISQGGAPGCAAALAAAQPLAAKFLAQYKPQGMAAAQVLEAFQAAELSTLSVRKQRLVVALGGLSPNFIDLRLRYARVMDALRQVRRGWYFCRVDAKSGFYQVKMHHTDTPYLGIAIETDPQGTVEHLTFGRLPMGLGPSGFIFSLYSGMVHSIFRARLKALGLDTDVVSIIFVDDFLVWGASRAILLQARAILLAVMAECGMTIALDKSPEDPVGPGQPRVADTALGLWVNLDTMTVSLPDIKLTKLLMFAIVLHALASQRIPVPTRALAQQGGRLTWMALIECTLPAYIRPLQNFGASGQGRWRAWARSVHRWSTPSAPSEEHALEHVLRKATAGAIQGTVLLSSAPRSSAVFYITSDASGPANAVCIATQSSVLRVVLPDCGGLSIPALEALATPIVLWRYGPLLVDATLVRGSDALGVCYQAAAGKSRRNDCNDLQKLTLLAAHTHNIVVTDKWLTRWENYLTDTGAGHPLPTLASRGIKAPPVQVELVLKGLPHQFLGVWARSMDPQFTFDTGAWEEVNDRGT
jgi:hypothetical protein